MLTNACGELNHSSTFTAFDVRNLQQKNTHKKERVAYIYIIGQYNPSVRFIDLVSHTTYVVFVNFIHKWRFKVDSELQIFSEKLFIAILFTFRVFARNLERGNRRRNIFRILF